MRAATHPTSSSAVPVAPVLPSLGEVVDGAEAVIARLDVDTDEGVILRAMGLGEGQRVSVLRRAPFGDPLHVRLSSGGEFALSRPLAQLVRVERRP